MPIQKLHFATDLAALVVGAAAEVELWGYGAWWAQILTLLNYVVVGIPSLVRMFSAEMRHMGTPTPGAIVPPT